MEPKVKEVGNLFIVDPNPPGSGGLEQFPPEDLFIYVKFSATPRSRQIFEGTNSNGQSEVFNGGVQDDINFIATEIKYNSEGIIETPFGEKTVDSYATTNWTGIGGNSTSGGILEGFGIKSIDIKYNASLVPVVDITFTDVRGSALFDTIKDNDRLSPYSIFFKMPYPVFKLSVKGYFGQNVEYCLHMVNWNSSFDGTTGNFDMTANFLGFQQAFLNDMNIGNVIANVNTEEGRKELDDLNWTFDDGDGNEFTVPEDIRKLDDFFLKISKLQIDSEVLKSNSPGFDELKDLNGQLKLLNQISGFIGMPIIKSTKKEDLLPENDYLNKKNNSILIESSKIKDNILVNNSNYLSIRDYLVINSVNENAYKSYINTLTTIINQYEKYVTTEGIKSNKDNSDELINSFFRGSDEKNYLNYVSDVTKNIGGISPEKLSVVLDAMGVIGTTLSLTKNYIVGNKNNDSFDLNSYNDSKNKGTLYSKEKGLNPDTHVFVVDFRNQRSLLQNLILIVGEDIKKKQVEVTETINNELVENFKSSNKFEPTIENCFRILANNTQALTSTIYSITKAATGQQKGVRNEILKQGGFSTDIPDSITTNVAWPSIYEKNGDKGETEIYLGEVNQTYNGSFPELDYIEKIYDALISKSKSLGSITNASSSRNGLDTDNWFPINPLDYSVNPYIEVNVLQDKDKLLNILANRFILRTSVLKNYSNFNSTTGLKSFSNYAKFDGINANLTIFNPDIRKILVEKLNSNNDRFFEELINTNFFKKYVTVDGDILTIENGLEVGGVVKVGGLGDKNISYIDFDNSNITTNSEKLWGKITEENSYVDLLSENNSLKKDENDTIFLKQNYKFNNLNTNVLYNVWDKAVTKKLYGTSTTIPESLSISSISDVDNPGGTTSDVGKYLNLTNFNVGKKIASVAYSGFMTDSELYVSQSSNAAKGLLLLSTIPFKPFKTSVLDPIFGGKYNGARIIKLPKYYVFLIGGYLWRYENYDKIFFNGKNVDMNSDKENYYTNFGYLSTTGEKGESIEIGDELLKLPSQTKDLLIEKFTDWVQTNITSDGSGKFEVEMLLYHSNSSSGGTESSSAKYLKEELSKKTDMIVFAPKIFDKTEPLPEKLTVTKTDVINYIDSFKNSFTKIEDTNDTLKEEETPKENNVIKLSLYNYFKNINDKWVSSTEKSFSVCGDNSTDDSNKNLIDYFKFIDRGWRPIGNEAVFNLNSFLNLGNEFKTSVYFFMSKLLRDSNFLFQILPTYVNFQDKEEVSKIFKPVTTLENNKSSGPIYACIYVGGASKVLDIQERTYGFKDDSFSFPDPNSDSNGTLPPDYLQEQKKREDKIKNSQVAFRVAFGAENQTVFKNVSLNQQEHKETGEYFRALSDLVDKRGGTQKTYQGTDLYKLFNTRSYTCKVDALGCMNIQPLMYFDLQNVPFFNGAYLITSVSHNITPNHMTTSFQGVRQSKFIAPPPTEITADLKLDLNESTDTSGLLDFTRNSINEEYVIGVENPNVEFDFNKFTVSSFTRMGVPSSVATVENILAFKTILKSTGVSMTTNKQVCMLLSNIMLTSNNMVNLLKPITVDFDKDRVGKFDDKTIYSGKTKNFGTNPPYPSNPFYEIYKDAGGKISGITPTFTSDTVNINTIAINNSSYDNKFGNTYEGDGYLFRPRGYLYVTGREEYFTFQTTKSKFTTPWGISLTPVTAFSIAVDVWVNKEKDGKTAFSVCESGEGGANIYSRTVEIVGDSNNIRNAFNSFEKVLNIFDLKDEFQLN